MSSGRHIVSLFMAALGLAPVPHARADSFTPSLDEKAFQALPAFQGGIHGFSAEVYKALGPRTAEELIAWTHKRQLLPLAQKPSAASASKQPVAIIRVQSQGTRHQTKEVRLPLGGDIATPSTIEESAVWNEAKILFEADTPVKLGQSNELTLVFRDIAGNLEVFPKSIRMLPKRPGLRVRWEVQVQDPQVPQVFVRDKTLLQWDAKNKSLVARDVGKSELFVTLNEQIFIIPVEIAQEQQERAEFRSLVEDERDPFQRLTRIELGRDQSLTYLGEGFASIQTSSEEVASAQVEDGSRRSPPLSLAQTVAAVDATRSTTLQRQARLGYPQGQGSSRRVAVQVVDERSVPELGILYPVSGAVVRLFGTQVAARTDAKGLAYFGDLPTGSRFWMSVEDEQGHRVPTVAELVLSSHQAVEVLRIKTLKFQTYFAYQNLLDLAQDSERGSICVRALSADSKIPLQGLRVSVNREAEGPFYIGKFGPERNLRETDESGRTCFFNVQPGLLEVSFFRGNELLTALSLPVFPGTHAEEELPLEDGRNRKLYLASLPSATEQLYDEQGIIASLSPVSFIDLIAVGINEAFVGVAPGVLASDAGGSTFKGRVYALSQAPEFENVIYPLDQDREIAQHLSVLPLLQRGFLEDLHFELSQHDGKSTSLYNPGMGQALIFHRAEGEDSAVKMVLSDSYGRVYDEAWYFGNGADGLVKAVFFNLNPGIYQLKIEDRQGAIVQMDTLAVDHWTTTFVQSGASLKYATGLSTSP